MKKLMFPLFAAFLLLSCNSSDEVVSPSNSTIGIRANNNKKVDICHNGHIINVSVNAIPAHLSHGDPIDFDGDGYFTGPNNCNKPVDCDDNDASHTNNCCETSLWCAFVNPNDVVISFSGTCGTTVVYDNEPCVNGPITWTLLSFENNVYTYQENNPCSDDDCIITITTIGNVYDEITITCGESSATNFLNPCEE